MRGRKKSYVVQLDEAETAQLRRVVASRKSSQSEVRRAKVILTCAEHPDWTDEQVATAVGCSPAMVRKWRQRWVETHSLKDCGLGVRGLFPLKRVRKRPPWPAALQKRSACPWPAGVAPNWLQP